MKKPNRAARRRKIKRWIAAMLDYDTDTYGCPFQYNHLLGVRVHELPCIIACPVFVECRKERKSIRPAVINYAIKHYSKTELLVKIMEKVV